MRILLLYALFIILMLGYVRINTLSRSVAVILWLLIVKTLFYTILKVAGRLY